MSSIKIAGGNDVANAIKGIKAGVANRVLKSAVGKVARKAQKTAKSRIKAKRLGLLSKAIGYLYRTYKKGTVWVYVIGPRKGFRQRVDAMPQRAQKKLIRLLGKRKRRKLTDAQVRILVAKSVDPVKYAHLVEGGRKAVRPTRKKILSDRINTYGKRARAVAPSPFMKPAADQIRASGAEVVADVKAGIEREAAKYAKRGKTIAG